MKPSSTPVPTTRCSVSLSWTRLSIFLIVEDGVLYRPKKKLTFDAQKLETICKLQRDVHNRHGRHRTLYNLLNVDRRASRAEIMEALQKVYEELAPGMQLCWAALVEAGQTEADGVTAQAYEHLPSSCADPAYVGLQADLSLAIRAADILWTMPSRAKYDSEVLHSFAVLAGIEDAERRDGPSSSRRGGGNLASQLHKKKKAEAKGDEGLWGLCEEYVTEPSTA